jgi:glycosyltransferase involved in cell wall biosynthesis
VSDRDLSALVVARDEERQLAECLGRLSFADEIVVVLDRCRDRSREIAARHARRLVEGAWEIEGERRNSGIEACRGPWILEVDADERVSDALAAEVRRAIAAGGGDVFDVPVDNYVGGRLVRHGWMAAIGTTSTPRLFRKGAKRYGSQRVHPHLHVGGRKGPPLRAALDHHLAGGISDLLIRLDRNTSLRAADLRAAGGGGTLPGAVRKIFSRFFKCYVLRRGYREKGLGVALALLAALYPAIAHLKATLEAPGAAEEPR